MKDVLKKKIEAGFMDKKVLLTTLRSPFLDSQYVFPYLGVLYLLAVAEKIGMRIKYIKAESAKISERDFRDHDMFFTESIELENVEQYKKFDLLGISCMTPQGDQAYQLRRQFKKISPETIVMIGGPHAKHYLQGCLEEKFDIVITGDGERVFEELLTGDISKLQARLSEKSSAHTLVFNDSLTEEEMNDYPVPFRHREYLARYNYLLDNKNATTLVNSRGCPMACSFCEDRRTKGRWYTPEHFRKEVENIIELGYKGIMIFDDLFAISLKRLKPYAEILHEFHEKNALVFRCFGHAKIMSQQPEIATCLARSGCVEIGFGAESASQEILDNVSKGIKVEEMRTFIETSIAAGMAVKAFFMAGLPGETQRTFGDSYDFVKAYREKYPDKFDFDMAIFFPYKGTVIGDVARLAAGQTMIVDKRSVDRTYFNIRPCKGVTWQEIDKGLLGAYKKKGGGADVVMETYDWQKGRVLLSAEQIRTLQQKALCLSGRYSDKEGRRNAPVVEGNIGSITSLKK